MSICNRILIFLFLSFSVYARTVPPVHVSAKQTSHTSISAGPIDTITQREMMQSGATSLTQTLQQYSGIEVQDILGNGTQAQLSLRGFGANASSNSLLMIDGIPITNPDLAPPDLTLVPLSAIQAIEITAGSESVLYGDQAVGGVINLITNTHSKDSTQIECGIGSYHYQQCNIHLENHKNQWAYHVYAAGNRSDNYRQHNHFNETQAGGLIQYLTDKRSLKFNFQLANEWQQYPGALTAQQVFANRRQANNATDYFKDLSDLLHVNYHQQLMANWHLNMDAAYRGMNGNGVLYSAFRQERDTYFFKPQLKGPLYNFIVTSGLDAQSDRYSLLSSFGFTRDIQQKYGLFALATYPISPKWSINFGARGARQFNTLNAIHSDNNAFASTVGASYQVSSKLNFYLRRAESFRFPKADENAFTTQIGGLKTQRGAAYETGIMWNDPVVEGKLGIYQINLRDEIAFDPLQTPEHPFGTNKNLSPTVRQGASLGLSKKLNPKLSFGGQYDYVKAQLHNGKRIPLVAENIVNAHLLYRINDNVNTYAETLYLGNQYSANDDENVAGKMGGYTVVNVNLQYHYKNWNAIIRINNLFNKAYYYYTVYVPSASSSFFYPAVERNVMLSLTYTLT